jgi:hypothetical protein
MKPTARVRLVPTCLVLILLISSSTIADGQDAASRPAGLDKYEAKAAESVEVTVDARVLQLAARALSDKDPEERAAKALLSGLKGVYVRALEFDREGVYQPADVESLRARFRGPEWSRVVGVRSKKYGENVEVYLSAQGGQIGGIAVVAAAPRELVYVSVSGPVDLERLRELEGRFRIPKLELFREGKE